jgi:hypothetical protein
VLVALSGVLSAAVRRTGLPSNPVAGLERDERPKVRKKVMRILDSAEVGCLLDAAAPNYRPVLATAASRGPRATHSRRAKWRSTRWPRARHSTPPFPRL